MWLNHNNPYKDIAFFKIMEGESSVVKSGDEIRKRNIAYRMRIGDILKGRPITEEERFLFLEMGDKRVVRINILANCVDKFIQDGEKKYATLTIDDASGQIKLKTFGDDIEILKNVTQGDTLQIIGNVREWNGELYIIPEVIKKVDPRWLLVRKLEIQNSRSDISVGPDGSSLKDIVMGKIKEAEKDGGIDTDQIIMDTESSKESVDIEIKKLLEEGLIYEPRPGKLRYLG